jgi:hypothetical protein
MFAANDVAATMDGLPFWGRESVETAHYEDGDGRRHETRSAPRG